ncbi:hypothetical protein FA95DRAFT_1657528, partial [Auriscalpium vulgare]
MLFTGYLHVRYQAGQGPNLRGNLPMTRDPSVDAAYYTTEAYIFVRSRAWSVLKVLELSGRASTLQDIPYQSLTRASASPGSHRRLAARILRTSVLKVLELSGRASTLQDIPYGPQALMDPTAGLSIKIPIPDGIISTLIPPHTLPISRLVHFPTSPTQNPPLLLRENLFSPSPSLINDSSSRLILSPPIPSLADVKALANQARHAVDHGKASFPYPVQNEGQSGKQDSVRLPLWVITFWNHEHDIIKAKTAWISAIAWLEESHFRKWFPTVKSRRLPLLMLWLRQFPSYLGNGSSKSYRLFTYLKVSNVGFDWLLARCNACPRSSDALSPWLFLHRVALL